MVFCTATRDKDEVVRLAFPTVICGCVRKCVICEHVCGVGVGGMRSGGKGVILMISKYIPGCAVVVLRS
jgi:hypothetical protein